MSKRSLILLTFAGLTCASTLYGAENLRLNQRLNYFSDSQDGPLITGDQRDAGAVPGEPNYIIFYGEG